MSEQLFITDQQLVALFFGGEDERLAWRLLRQFDADKRSGFPQKQELFGGRRYFAAVKVYFDTIYIPRMQASPGRATDDRRTQDRPRPRLTLAQT